MKGKHAKNTANKQKLAKRMLALCFAVVFLCSCVLPVFATGSSLLTDALREAVEETAASTDASTEAGGGTMMDSFQTMMDSYTTEYKTTYRFWLSEKDSYYLPDAAKTSASDLEGYDDFYAVAAIVNNTTLTAPEGFQNPTDPTGAGRKFEGWYYIDTYGVTQTFTFDGSPVLLDKSATIDVFAKWEKVESTVEDEMEKTEPTTEDELDKTESGKANESKEETLPPVEKTGAVGLTNNEGDTVRIAVKAENLPGKVNELVVTDLNEDEEGKAFGNALGASNYADWTVTNLMVNITPKDAEGNTVEPNEAVTVHFSGLESLMIQYSSEMNLKVLHMKRDGTLEALPLKNVQTKETQEGTVLSSFAVSTTSFSPFVLAASESASIEPAKLDLGEYPAGDKYTYNNYRQITVGESIVVSCDGDHWYGSYTWSSSDNSVIKIVSSDANTVRIKAVETGKATISHGRWCGSYTFYVAPSRGTENASIFFLNTPNADEDSNSTSQWLPSGGNSAWQVNGTAMDGTINTTSAKWDAGDGNKQNKNIFLQDTDNASQDTNNASGKYVTKWPDGATTKAWTLYNPRLHETQPTEYAGTDWTLNNAVFTNVLDQMWDGYKSYLGEQLDVTGLTLEEAKKKITQITLTPYKISKNNDMHIDCTIGVTGISYEAKFWVKAPGKTVYEQAYGKTYADKNGSAITEPNSIELSSWKDAHHGAVTLDRDGSLPEEITGDNGVHYTLKKWYKEDGSKASFPHTPSADEKHDGIVNFYAEYVADNQGKLDQYPYITVEKQIIGLPSDKVDELLEHFKVNVGRFELTRDNYDLKSTVDGVTTLRWKIDSATANSYNVTESGYNVDGYNLTIGGDVGKTFDVKDATFEASAEVITSGRDYDFEVGEDGNNQYWVFVASLTSQRNVVISNRTLSAKERASIIKAVAGLHGAISNNSIPSTTDFYSITKNQEITIKDGNKDYKITYSNYNNVVQGPGIHIVAENMWNMVAKVTYSVADAESADIKLTNTYTPATTNLTVTKTVTGNMADLGEKFTFQISIRLKDGVAVDPENVEWSKGNDDSGNLNRLNVTTGGYTFTLKHNESIVFSGIPTGAVVTVTEINENGNLTGYETRVVIDGVESTYPSDSNDERKGTVKLDATAKTIAFTNTKQIPVPTGVILDTLPYVLMLIAVGGGVVAFFLRRRHHDDEE